MHDRAATCRALKVAAQIVQTHGPRYLPVFAALEDSLDQIDRSHRVAAWANGSVDASSVDKMRRAG